MYINTKILRYCKCKIYKIQTDTITPSTAVRDLGIYINSDLSMQTHVQRSVAGCFAVLCQLRPIRRLVPSTVYQSLVTALVLPRLDYSNATLAGLPAYLLNRLQSVTLSSTRQPGLWLDFGARSILQMLLPVFTGYEHSSALSYRLPGSSWHCTSVLIRSAAARCPSADEMPWSPPFDDFQSSRRPSIAMCYHRISDRSFATAVPRLWNSLPVDIQYASPLVTFCQKLKTHSFRQSYPDIII